MFVYIHFSRFRPKICNHDLPNEIKNYFITLAEFKDQIKNG